MAIKVSIQYSGNIATSVLKQKVLVQRQHSYIVQKMDLFGTVRILLSDFSKDWFGTILESLLLG